jgi:hypothetical protein
VKGEKMNNPPPEPKTKLPPEYDVARMAIGRANAVIALMIGFILVSLVVAGILYHGT